jgi:hypothetical protein
VTLSLCLPPWGMDDTSAERPENATPTRELTSRPPPPPSRRSCAPRESTPPPQVDHHLADFLRSQAHALLACDFLETATRTGQRLYVFAVTDKPRPGTLAERDVRHALEVAERFEGVAAVVAAHAAFADAAERQAGHEQLHHRLAPGDAAGGGLVHEA